jgi:NADP-dependent 3-hydroxy acid dehydrogenase YdfG
MEVTDDASMNEALRSIEQKAGPVQLLVNNAGYSVTGALEATSIEEAKQQFETNFFGVLRVTNAVLVRSNRSKGSIRKQLRREQKVACGRIHWFNLCQ